MKAKFVCLVALLAFVTLPCLAFAQEKGEPGAGAEVVKPGEKNPAVFNVTTAQPRYYRLDFVLRETEEGKTLNQRAFTINVRSEPADTHGYSNWWTLRAGNRIPVPDGKGTFNYIDVGVDIDIGAKESDSGALQLEVTSNISSIAADAEKGSAAPIRQMKVRAAVLAPIGKPTVVFTTDDPASRHQFELQVTPTREK